MQAINPEKRQAALVLFHLIWASVFFGHYFFHSMSARPVLLLKASHSAAFAEKIWGQWGWNEH